MKLPSFIYRSERVGLHGKPFSVYKIRTMKLGTKTSFAGEEHYTKHGKFLRKTKIDEFLQLVNVLKGEMRLVGPRSNVQEYWDIAPEHVKKKILSTKPGLTSLASIMFHDEEFLLQGNEDKYKNYYTIIAPMKNSLDMFYVDYHDIFLDIWILFKTSLIIIKKIFQK